MDILRGILFQQEYKELCIQVDKQYKRTKAFDIRKKVITLCCSVITGVRGYILRTFPNSISSGYEDYMLVLHVISHADTYVW